MACVASVPALEWHAAQDWSAQLEKNRALSDMIIAAADEAGFELASPRDPAQRGGSVMVRLPDADQAQALLGRLRAVSVFADARGAIFRCSPGFITTQAGVNRLVAALAGGGKA